MTFVGLISPQGSVPLAISSTVFVLVSEWEVDCVFRHAHIRPVYVGLWDETLFMCKKCLQTPPILFLLAQTLSLPYSVSLSFSLTHTLILFLCSLTRGTALNNSCCTVKCTKLFSILLLIIAQITFCSLKLKVDIFGASNVQWVEFIFFQLVTAYSVMINVIK